MKYLTFKFPYNRFIGGFYDVLVDAYVKKKPIKIKDSDGEYLPISINTYIENKTVITVITCEKEEYEKENYNRNE